MTAPAPMQGLSDADALLAQSDDDFARTFGLAIPGAAPAAPASEPAAPATPPADPATPAPPSGEPARDDKGRFTGTEAPAPAGDPATPDAPAKADAEPAPTAPAKAKPITDFKVFDHEGDEVEVGPIEVEFKGNKEVKRLPLDHLVRLAQFGAYNKQLHDEVETARTQLPQMEQTVTELNAQLQAQQALNRRLLGDEQFYAQSAEQYAKAQTPEARAERAERALRDRDARDRGQAHHSQALVFLPKLEGALQGIVDANPEVSFEELWGRFTLRTQNMIVRGSIPPERYSELETLVSGDLRLWAQQLNDERTDRRTQHASATDGAVKKAQEEAARAKKLLTRKIKPVGAPPESQTTAARPTKPPETVQEAVDSVLADLKASFDRSS